MSKIKDSLVSPVTLVTHIQGSPHLCVFTVLKGTPLKPLSEAITGTEKLKTITKNYLLIMKRKTNLRLIRDIKMSSPYKYLAL